MDSEGGAAADHKREITSKNDPPPEGSLSIMGPSAAAAGEMRDQAVSSSPDGGAPGEEGDVESETDKKLTSLLAQEANKNPQNQGRGGGAAAAMSGPRNRIDSDIATTLLAAFKDPVSSLYELNAIIKQRNEQAEAMVEESEKSPEFDLLLAYTVQVQGFPVNPKMLKNAPYTNEIRHHYVYVTQKHLQVPVLLSQPCTDAAKPTWVAGLLQVFL